MRCMVCNQELKGKTFYGEDYYWSLSPKRYSYIICKYCDSANQSPALGPEELKKAYPKNYYSYVKITKKNFLVRLREAIVRHNIDQSYSKEKIISFFTFLLKGEFQGLLPSETGGGRNFLDIGCGNGDNLVLLSDYSWNCFGVEIDSAHVQYLRCAGLNVFCGFESIPNELKFSAIRLWHVLEHFHQPAKYIKHIHQILEDGGCVYLSIPIRSGLVPKIFGKYWIGYDAPRHTVAFSKKSSIKFFEDNGFKIKKMTGTSMSGFLWSLSNFLKKNLGLKNNIANNQMLVMFFYPLDFLIDLFGASDIINFELIKN